MPRAKSLAAGMPPDLPPRATGTDGHGGLDPHPSDEGEKELVVVRG
jgi:hypothetical protein